MPSTLSPAEEAQLTQTIEMFEVITQSQPNDYQSLEILKEAYSKLGRETEVVATSKRIAQTYVELGQLSSAILEYETILQRLPNDPDVHKALRQIENMAGSFGDALAPAGPEPVNPVAPAAAPKAAAKAAPRTVDDGRAAMRKIFVDGKVIAAADFDLCWVTPDFNGLPNGVIEPFIQVLADKGIVPVEKSLKILSDKSRVPYLPMERYDIDIELTRGFPAEVCKRWCVLPFDRMSKSIFVATANPYNLQAAQELSAAIPNRLLWYLAPPAELVKNLNKAFR